MNSHLQTRQLRFLGGQNRICSRYYSFKVERHPDFLQAANEKITDSKFYRFGLLEDFADMLRKMLLPIVNYVGHQLRVSEIENTFLFFATGISRTNLSHLC